MKYNVYRLDFADSSDLIYYNIQSFKYNGMYVDFIDSLICLISDHVLTINDLNKLSDYINTDIIIGKDQNVIFIYNDYIE